jgi:hypothetical protein
MILLASIFLVAACNGDDSENSSDNGRNDQVEENDDTNDTNSEDESEDEQQDVYQIGETAASESSSYGFPYEVTVNDFQVTADEVNGSTIADYYAEGFEPSEETRFAVVNITMTNTGDDAFSVNDSMTPVLDGEFTSETPETNAMQAFDEEIPPGEEITADLIFITDTILTEDEMVNLFFNIHDPNLEFKFELPIP